MLPLRVAVGLIGMLLASLLAILNEQVTASAMADIQGALSIGHDDGTGLTALFEATNVATMIFAPWFGMTFSMKRFTIGAVLAILFLGILCPFAPNQPAPYALRVLQGIAGGCLPPMLIIVALRYLPPKVMVYGLAGYALTATVGPELGTPLSALWTKYVGWRMVFFQIVPLDLDGHVQLLLRSHQVRVAHLEVFRPFVARYLKSVGDARPVVTNRDARYYGGRVEELWLVPLGDARIGRISLDQWLAQAKRN